MGVLWDKVWFDLWRHKGRTMLAVLSIAAGVFAIGAIFGMVDHLLANLDAEHQAIQPAHMNIFLRQPIDRETADSLEDIPGIVGVEALNLANIRYKIHPEDEWSGATLVMRDDYNDQTYDWLLLKEGVWPENKGVGVERLGSNFWDIEVGDEVIFEMDGSDRSLPITGKIRHPLIAPPDFGGNAYFFVDSAGMARFGIPEGQFLQLLVRVEPYSEDYARDRAVAIKEELNKQDIGVSVIIYQDPNEHWARPVLAGINLVLQILAIISLLTSVIIVINTTTAVITQQTDQIGVIKAIGGSSGLIVRVYLVGVLVYGLLALLIALPLGLFVAFGATQGLLALFNIDYDTLEISQSAVTWQLLAAIVAPLLAALWPVLQGASMSVREAIASYGLGGDFGRGRLDRFVESLSERFLPSYFAIAVTNVFRRKGRLLLTQSVLILAGTTFLMVLTLASSMSATLDNELARRGYDIHLFFMEQERSDRVADLAAEVEGVSAAEAWLSITGNVLRDGERVEETGGLGAELIGIPTGSEMYRPHIVDGRWLSLDDSGYEAVISQELAEFNDVSVGDILTVNLGDLGEGDWQVVGTFQPVTADLFTTDPVYVPADTLVQVTKKVNKANQIVVRAEDQDSLATAQLMEELTDLFQARRSEVNLFFSRTKSQDREFAFNQFGIVNNMLFGLALIMGIVGGIGLMGSLSISVVERTREIGVLRSIGAETPTIMIMFILEGVVQGLMSWLVAVPLSFVVARPVATILGQIIFNIDLDFVFSNAAVVTWLIAILCIATLAAIVPAHAAARVSVRESLAYA